MICDSCTKKDVCKYKEDCIKFEQLAKDIGQSSDCNFTIEVKCKHKETGTVTRNPILPNYPTPPWAPISPCDKRIMWGGSTCKGGDINA
jgi:hypothetical protein